jgi:polyphosphate kinase 2 (PPK2 family)
MTETTGNLPSAVTPAEAPQAAAVSHPSPEDIRRVFESGRYPYKRKMSRRTYEAEKARLQAELLKVQIWAQDTGQKFAMVFEGRDAAGKGGRSNALPST